MKVYLIDGTAICYRAYYSYATRHLRNSKGFPTNVPYGFYLCLRKIMSEFKPDGLVVMFDVKGPTFRHEKYEEYKAHRKPTPEDLILQLPLVKRLVEALKIPIMEREGFEADDMIGTAARALSKKGHEVIIVTGDKDACQLVDSKVRLMDPGKDYALMGSKEVEERLGVPPGRVADLLALAGDSSDNIPGVPGIGMKTATQLIQEFGSLEGVYKNLEMIKSESKRKVLKENRDSADLSLELSTIDCDVPVKLDPADWKLEEPDLPKLISVFKELEFRSFLKELPQSGPETSKSYRLVADDKGWSALLGKLKKAESIAFDFETTGTDPMTAEPVGVSFCLEPHEAHFVLFKSHTSGRSPLKAKEVLGDLKGVFEDAGVGKIGQNIKYEMAILRNFDIRLSGVAFDTMVASYLLNPSKPNHNLADLAMEYLDEQLVRIESLIGSGKKQISMAEAEVDKLYAYGCQDSDVAWRLAEVLKKKIREADMERLLLEVEMPLIEVLCDMEIAGIGVDTRFLGSLSKTMEKGLAGLTKDIYRLAGEEFNINSPKQLSEVLFTRLKLPVIRRTKTGFSTDAEVLTQLAARHELPASVLRFRELSKLKSTYVDTLPGLVNKRTGRVHSSFNQTVTETGRLSSSDPNMQNIPVRTEEGRQIRKGFVAQKGKEFVSADYSQIELRILAHLSRDEKLRGAFRDGVDVHAFTAGLIFGASPDKVAPEMRDQAKTVNFGVLYGMSPFGLARSLGISQEAARDFIQAYFERYPGVKRYLDETIASARKKGYVETLFKRRRYIPAINSPEVQLRQFAERTAINAPVQGSASDLIKIAMVAVHRRLQKERWDARMLLQVHDELLFEVAAKDCESLIGMARKEMEGALKLEVPIEVHVKAGKNWMEMERLPAGKV